MTSVPSPLHQLPPLAADAPTVLRADRDEARVRTWPGRPGTAQLALADHRRPPHPRSVSSWVARLVDCGYVEVRTGAVTADVAACFERAGFQPIQHLVVLRLDLHRADLGRPDRRRRVLAGHVDLTLASSIDRAAFGSEWGLDTVGIHEACTATPHHRARFALADDGTPIGYSITGRSGRRGFLQRLAVQPEHQRTGAGRALVLDGARWLRRWRAAEVLVNTHHDNIAALQLYQRIGFVRLDESLMVLHRVLTPLTGPSAGVG